MQCPASRDFSGARWLQPGPSPHPPQPPRGAAHAIIIFDHRVETSLRVHVWQLPEALRTGTHWQRRVRRLGDSESRRTYRRFENAGDKRAGKCRASVPGSCKSNLPVGGASGRNDLSAALGRRWGAHWQPTGAATGHGRTAPPCLLFLSSLFCGSLSLMTLIGTHATGRPGVPGPHPVIRPPAKHVGHCVDAQGKGWCGPCHAPGPWGGGGGGVHWHCRTRPEPESGHETR